MIDNQTKSDKIIAEFRPDENGRIQIIPGI